MPHRPVTTPQLRAALEPEPVDGDAVDGVSHPALEPRAGVAELEGVRVGKVGEVDSVWVGHVVELRLCARGWWSAGLA